CVLVAELFLAQLVLAPALLALAEALDERVGEAGEMPGRLPDRGVLDDRRVQRDDVFALLQHRPPPLVLDVVLEQDAVVPIVVGVGVPAVDLRRREDEAAPLAGGDDLVGLGELGHGQERKRRLACGARIHCPLPSCLRCRSTSTAASTATPSRWSRACPTTRPRPARDAARPSSASFIRWRCTSRDPASTPPTTRTRRRRERTAGPRGTPAARARIPRFPRRARARPARRRAARAPTSPGGRRGRGGGVARTALWT